MSEHDTPFSLDALQEQMHRLQQRLDRLQAREALYRTLIEQAPIPMAVHREETFVFINPAGLRLLGAGSPEDVLGRSVWDFVDRESRELVRERLRKLHRREAVPFTVERLRRLDGSTFLGEVKGVPITLEGEPAVLVVLRDVTERVHAEEHLLDQKDQYRHLVEEINEVIFQLDAEGRFTYVSPAIERMSGYTAGDLVGRSFTELIHPDDLAGLQESFERTLAGHLEPYEFRVVLRDGSYRHIRTSSRVILQDGHPVGVRGLATDITERKQAEAEREHLIAELEAKNRELERFTYTVSHDLKSPLFTIRGFLGLLEEDSLAGDLDQVREDIRHIQNATETMQRLLDDLLTLSRVGRITNPPEAIPLTSLVNEAVERVTGQIRARGVEVRIAPDLPEVYGDRTRLVDVLQNLIENAVKYAGEGAHPVIEIGGATHGNRVEVFVRDNGPGIPPQYHEKVFGLFERLDNKTEGTGIGLALVKRIVEVHGGRVWIDSSGTGDGCTVRFTLPRPERAGDG